MARQEMFLVWFTYGDLDRGIAEFKRYFSQKNMYKEWKTLERKYCRAQKNYVGNMYADTSHLDYEILEMHSRKELEDYAKDAEMTIDWENKIMKEEK